MRGGGKGQARPLLEATFAPVFFMIEAVLTPSQVVRFLFRARTEPCGSRLRGRYGGPGDVAKLTGSGHSV
jgi:hypothetical protein